MPCLVSTPEVIRPADSNITTLYTKEAVQFIRKQSKQKPFFLYLAHNMPHLPVAAVAALTELLDRYNGNSSN